MDRLLNLLKRLDLGGIHYHLSHFRDDSVAVEVSVPGERWEIEFMIDGSIEVERFVSDGRIDDEQILDELIRTHSS